MKLAALQQVFIEGVYRQESPEAEALLEANMLSPKAQMTLYHRHTIAALSEVLALHYPAIEKVVGRKFLKAAARAFIDRHPQQHANLELYGTGFPEFLAGYAPARKLTYLPDLARFERALHEAGVAEEKGSLTLADFALEPDTFLALRLTPHPSLRLVESHFPVKEIWRLAMEGAEDETLDLSQGGGQWRVMRVGGEVEAEPIPRAEFEYLSALAEGRPLIDAFGRAETLDAEFSLENALKTHIVQGLFTGMTTMPGI